MLEHEHSGVSVVLHGVNLNRAAAAPFGPRVLGRGKTEPTCVLVELLGCVLISLSVPDQLSERVISLTFSGS